MMGGEEGLYDAWGGAPGPNDPGLAWDAAERYAVRLLREALPEAQAVPVPVGELTAEAARFRSAARKWPYRQLARAAWGQRPRKRSPADDTDLWLDAAGAVATMRRHIAVHWTGPEGAASAGGGKGSWQGRARTGAERGIREPPFAT